jgi:hypothetical protein
LTALSRHHHAKETEFNQSALRTLSQKTSSGSGAIGWRAESYPFLLARPALAKARWLSSFPQSYLAAANGLTAHNANKAM